MKAIKKKIIEYLSDPKVKILDYHFNKGLTTKIDPDGWRISKPTGKLTINLTVFKPIKR